MTTTTASQPVFYKTTVSSVYRFGNLQTLNDSHEVFNGNEQRLLKQAIQDVVLIRHIDYDLKIKLQILGGWDEFDTAVLKSKVTLLVKPNAKVQVELMHGGTTFKVAAKEICLDAVAVDELVKDGDVKRVPMHIINGSTHANSSQNNNRNIPTSLTSPGQGNASGATIPSSSSAATTTNPTVEFKMRAFYKILNEPRDIYRLGVVEKTPGNDVCRVFRGDGSLVHQDLLEDLIIFSKLPKGFHVCLPTSCTTSTNCDDFFPATLGEDIVGILKNNIKTDFTQTLTIWDYIRETKKSVKLQDICMEVSWMDNLFSWTDVAKRASSVIPSLALPPTLRMETVIQYFSTNDNKPTTSKRTRDDMNISNKNSDLKYKFAEDIANKKAKLDGDK